ncbi:hypothetical protein F4009_00035 [Candidatus Poribacteria bacterium]|nr:hypothetical protein [Candidatus Poribacteria bacterium]MYH79204.1 hypothetical protein [Candidatus Poribacteria bacterium]MYK92389.1 hypothetical protein [Candidatus Poribacteria bacterium]
MKRHHIVGIIAGIGGIGLTVRHALSASIIEALITFTLFSGLTIATFFKDRLRPRWSHEILPFWMCIIVVCLMLLEILDYFP